MPTATAARRGIRNKARSVHRMVNQPAIDPEHAQLLAILRYYIRNRHRPAFRGEARRLIEVLRSY